MCVPRTGLCGAFLWGVGMSFSEVKSRREAVENVVVEELEIMFRGRRPSNRPRVFLGSLLIKRIKFFFSRLNVHGDFF